jgi:hypothetical protein
MAMVRGEAQRHSPSKVLGPQAWHALRRCCASRTNDLCMRGRVARNQPMLARHHCNGGAGEPQHPPGPHTPHSQTNLGWSAINRDRFNCTGSVHGLRLDTHDQPGGTEQVDPHAVCDYCLSSTPHTHAPLREHLPWSMCNGVHGCAIALAGVWGTMQSEPMQTHTPHRAPHNHSQDQGAGSRLTTTQRSLRLHR